VVLLSSDLTVQTFKRKQIDSCSSTDVDGNSRFQQWC